MASSLIDLIAPIAAGQLLAKSVDLRWIPGAAVTTVLASGGYPGPYPTGVPIHIPGDLDEGPNIRVYHAGTKIRDGSLVTDGGRVLAVTALASTVRQAADESRAAAERIEFAGRTYRRDIGRREIARS
jgi:phosphoribosylamine-glycine ligase